MNLLDTMNNWLSSRTANQGAAPSGGGGTAAFSPWAQNIQNKVGSMLNNRPTYDQNGNQMVTKAGMQKILGAPDFWSAFLGGTEAPTGRIGSTSGTGAPPPATTGTSGYGGSSNATAGGPKFPPYMQPPNYWQQALPYAQWGAQYQMPPFYQRPQWMQGPGLLG